jgi:hypothetical protein
VGGFYFHDVVQVDDLGSSIGRGDGDELGHALISLLVTVIDQICAAGHFHSTTTLIPSLSYY